ncbi:cobalt/nickel transport system permease protein [Peptostreptococcaceae bacterium pGA-8]|nr:cobalt/nickel transport system permease protein [Peptostreptococcaceae bacterium pGA-8]
MLTIDKLCYLSKLRYENPTEKFLYAILTLLFCIISRSVAMGIIVMAVNRYLTVHKGGISSKRYFHLMMIPFTFLVLSTLAIVVNISKTPLDAYAIPVGDYFVTGSYAGVWKGVQLCVTALASVSCLYFLSLNTTMTDIFSVMRKFKVPNLFIELMLLIYRYIFILLDVAMRIGISQDSRLGNKNYRTAIKSFSGLLSALFVRAMHRSRYLFDSMEARGYDGEIKVLEEHYPVNKKAAGVMCLFHLVLLAVTVYIKVQGVVFI